MIAPVISYILRHRALVVALLLIFVAVGIYSYQQLPVEAFPDVSNVSVQVITLFPGHAAEEVERLVTIPIENQMNSVPKLVALRSISLFGLSQVTLVFKDGTDPDYARNQVNQFLGEVSLPPGANASLSPNATPIGEIYRYTLQAPPGYPKVELKALEDWVVARKLLTVPGVVDVVGFGGPTKQYQVLVDPARLKAYDITLAQVFTALANGNCNAGGSYVEHGSEMYVVRGLGYVHSTADIGAIAVATRGGTPILIRDIGKVVIGHAVRLGRVGILFKRPDGSFDDHDDAVQGIVIMRRAENPNIVLAKVHVAVAQINAKYLPAGIRMVPHYDRTELIDRTLHTVRTNMIEGILLVVGVLVLFLGLGNLRSALVVAVAVPVSLLGAFTLLNLSGIPANLISMGAIDFGIIVDSSVVIIENLIRILHERKDRTTPLGSAIIESVAQMGRPILFSKAILLTAFIPLYTMQRVEGRIFRPMALTLTFALASGTLFAVFVVPALASFALQRGVKEERSWIVRNLVRLYLPALDFAQRRRGLVYAVALALVAAGGIAFYFIGSEFLPELDEGALWVRIFMPRSIAPTEAAKITRIVRRRLASFPEATNVLSQLGRPDDGTDINGFDVAEFNVNLRPRSKWTTAHSRDGLVAAMSRNLAEIPGVRSQFSQYIEDNVNEAVSGIKSELAIKLYGEDPETLQQLADRIAAIIAKVPGAKDVGADQWLGQPQIQIKIDRAAIARYGLSVADVQSIVETAMGGAVASQVLEGQRTFDLVVKLSPRSVSDVESIRKIPVFGANGERLTLGALAAVNVRTGLAALMRENNERRIAIKLSVRGRSLGDVVAEAQRKVAAAVALPRGYRLEWTGSFENEQRAMRRLAVVVPVTLLLVFFLLFTTFDSGKLSALILINSLYAAAGGVLALPLAGLNLSVAAMVGFIALFGISIQNRIILVARIRELRGLGRHLADAVREGAVSRIRPMVMTALMAMLGLLPVALSHGAGAETARPFAVVIIGGLIADTLLTIFVVPLLYPYFDKEPAR